MNLLARTEQVHHLLPAQSEAAVSRSGLRKQNFSAFCWSQQWLSELSSAFVNSPILYERGLGLQKRGKQAVQRICCLYQPTTSRRAEPSDKISGSVPNRCSEQCCQMWHLVNDTHMQECYILPSLLKGVMFLFMPSFLSLHLFCLSLPSQPPFMTQLCSNARLKRDTR